MTQKTLDLRYNELWDDWHGSDEFRGETSDAHGQFLLSWRHLSVSVKQITQKFFKRSEITYKQILNNVNGNVQCGTLLGIMGPSGSGKTTLIATISQRMKGNFDGELLFNGRPISEEVMINISGFVPQHDISFDQLTVLEHLSLMAVLKMDRRTTRAEVKRRVDGVVNTLGMVAFLNTRISFLSGGERKKVALAVQLLNDPPILFCDEITTGLDSYWAAHIVNTLRGVARTGKIVVCTIHQPASGVFGKFDEVLLLSNGRLVCQGPVHMVRQLFGKFNYECPRMFNEADYVISVLNSDSDKVRRDVDEMCRLSSSGVQTDIDYDFFYNQVSTSWICRILGNCRGIIRRKKPIWITQFSLIFNRSMKCFIRSYKTKILELGTMLFLGLVISFPYANMSLDSQASQNLEGFWLMLIIFCLMHVTHTSTLIYHIQFSTIHREIHNEVYSLSAYYVSELIIMGAWTLIKVLHYGATAFTIVGFEWGGVELFVISTVAFSALSIGSLLSACFEDIQNTFTVVTVYEYLALSISGAYLSLKSLPRVFYPLRFLSLFFLGCEVASTLFWDRIQYLPCEDVNDCLDSGKAVLFKYGYISENFHSDITIMISFCILANVCGYFGVLKKMRKQPAY